MEFRFDINDVFKQPIVEIGNTLIPPGFSGDKRALWDTQSKVIQIVNSIGEASARAQGLTKPITTSDRLRNSEHRLYLLIDQSANHGKGAVTGMLKTGEKGLYVFDREGQHYKVSPPCVLDFYIHESRQRAGFGRQLFEYMLQRENTEPVKMAIDRPSDKFLGFLHKHYGLSNPVKQMNNYVVYDGFFPGTPEISRPADADKSHTPTKKQSANGLQQTYSTSPYGRYAAPRPPCSMGQIIHNDSPVIKRNQEPTGVRSEPITNIHGQETYYQQPAWQSPQSVPNIQYAYQNTPNHQTPSNYNYPCPQNQMNAPNYITSGGDPTNLGQQQAQNPCNMYNAGQQISNNNAQQAAQGYNPYQNPAQVPSDVAQYTSPQGHSQQIEQIGQASLNQNIPQGMIQYAIPQDPNQQVTYPTQVTQPQYNQNIQQSTVQYTSPQGQNYYYNHETQQYYSANQTMSQTTAPYYQENPKIKEPLIPQAFDGTARKMPHVAQSVPLQPPVQQNPSIMLQNSVSAPVGNQQYVVGGQSALPSPKMTNAAGNNQALASNRMEQLSRCVTSQQTYRHMLSSGQDALGNHDTSQHQPTPSPQITQPEERMPTAVSPMAIQNAVTNQGDQKSDNQGQMHAIQAQANQNDRSQNPNVAVVAQGGVNVGPNHNNQDQQSNVYTQNAKTVNPMQISNQQYQMPLTHQLVHQPAPVGTQGVVQPISRPLAENAVATTLPAPSSTPLNQAQQSNAYTQNFISVNPMQVSNQHNMSLTHHHVHQPAPVATQVVQPISRPLAENSVATTLPAPPPSDYMMGDQVQPSQNSLTQNQQPMMNAPFPGVEYQQRSSVHGNRIAPRGRFVQNVRTDGYPEESTNVGDQTQTIRSTPCSTEVDITKGYPPQHQQTEVSAATPVIIRN